jgi:hypothetical protein
VGAHGDHGKPAGLLAVDRRRGLRREYVAPGGLERASR